MTSAGNQRFLERARRTNFGDPAPAPEPPVPRGFRGWPGQLDFPDLTAEEIAVRYLSGGSPRLQDHEQEQYTKRLVRAWLAARHAAAERRPP